MASEPLRLVVFDAAARGPGPLPGLAGAWRAGALLYSALGRTHASVPARGVGHALRQITEIEPGRPIAELQFWCHGKWGDLRLGSERLDVGSFERGSALRPALDAVRARLVGADALVWLRTCESFGADAGQRFAQASSDYWGCRVAGHTYVIGVWQSGLHALNPGERITWSSDEGLLEGSPMRPLRARVSTPLEPNTITCFDGVVPDHFT